MKKSFDTVRLELGEYFRCGTNFYDWEKEAGVFNDSISTMTKKEVIVYYEKVINVIKAFLKTLSLSDRTNSIGKLIYKYIYYNDYDAKKVEELFNLYNQGKEDFESDFDDCFLDDLYNELFDAVVQDRIDLFEYQEDEVRDNSSVKGEEFDKILNSLPLDKILMNRIIKIMFE